MPNPAKTLDDHVNKRTFRARRHHELLDGELVANETLRELQADYQQAGNPRLRRAIALDFEKAVQEHEPQGLTPEQALYASCGLFSAAAHPELIEYAPLVDKRDKLTVLEWRWADWDRRWGLRFRLYHGIPDDQDRLTLARRVGLATENLAKIRERWPELIANAYPRGLRRVPAPPGFEHV